MTAAVLVLSASVAGGPRVIWMCPGAVNGTSTFLHVHMHAGLRALLYKTVKPIVLLAKGSWSEMFEHDREGGRCVCVCVLFKSESQRESRVWIEGPAHCHHWRQVTTKSGGPHRSELPTRQLSRNKGYPPPVVTRRLHNTDK